MTIDRAIEILDPNHREHYDSIEVVNEACRMGAHALKMLYHCDLACFRLDIVRCKDCKYWVDEHGKAQRADGVLYARCRIHNHEVGDRNVGWVPTEDDFCSCGERKETDND